MATSSPGPSARPPCKRAPGYRRWALMLVLVLLMAAGGPAGAWAVAEPEESIFQRFALKRQNQRFQQASLEIPLYLRPQTDPDSKINQNLGFNYLSAYRPEGRFYASRSIGIAITEWEPTAPEVRKVKVKTFDISILLNRLHSSSMVSSFGLGLGMMDGTIYFAESPFYEPRLEPFIPIHIGLAVRLGENFQLGLKFTQFSFFRTDPVISFSRTLLGVGLNY